MKKKSLNTIKKSDLILTLKGPKSGNAASYAVTVKTHFHRVQRVKKNNKIISLLVEFLDPLTIFSLQSFSPTINFILKKDY